VRTCVSNRDTDPPIQKLLHTVGVLCIDYYYEACQRKGRSNSWDDCHSRVAGRSVSTASAERSLLGFRARASRISSLAPGRGGPRYALLRGGQQGGLKKRLSSPTCHLDLHLKYLELRAAAQAYEPRTRAEAHEPRTRAASAPGRQPRRYGGGAEEPAPVPVGVTGHRTQRPRGQVGPPRTTPSTQPNPAPH
jgi:hypothetical protein